MNTLLFPTPDPGWLRRGVVCRDRRVHGHPYMTQREIAGLIGLPTQAVCDMEFGRADPAPLEDWWAHEDGVVAGLRRLVDRVREGDRG